MNTTRKLLILCLALVMGITAIIPSTFSWFSHSVKLTGQGMRYWRQNLNVSNGAISMSTLQFDTDANYQVRYDAHKDKIIKSGAPSKTVVAGATNYYQTTFTYSGSASAYAGFYLNGITNSAKVKIGNNYPTITEKKVGQPTRTPYAYSETRIYFQPNDAKGWDNSGSNLFYLVGISKNANNEIVKTAVRMNSQTATDFDENGDTYYAELPTDSLEFYIAKASGSTAAGSATKFDRTQTFTKVVPSTVYTLTGSPTNDDNGYAACTTQVSKKLIGLTSCYSKVTMAAGQTVYIALPLGYNAASVSYGLQNSGDSTKYDIDSRTGRCKVKETGATGGLKTTLTGQLGDTLDLITNVDIPSTLDNIPVCQNIKMDTSAERSTVKIEWYITNNSSSDATFQSIYATI